MASHALQKWKTGSAHSALTFATPAASDTIEGWRVPNPHLGLLLRNVGGTNRTFRILAARHKPAGHPHGEMRASDVTFTVPASTLTPVLLIPDWYHYRTAADELLIGSGTLTDVELASVIFPCEARLYGTSAFGPWERQL